MRKFLIILFVLFSQAVFAEEITWTQSTASAAFTPHSGYASLTFDAKVWTISTGSGPGYAEVWYSSNGADWTLATGNAEFGKRAHTRALSFDNKMWIFGGIGVEDEIGIEYNDVWNSTDGIEWTAVTRNAEFSSRAWHEVLVYDNKMWVLGGSGESIYYNDVWYSSDGVSWGCTTTAAAWMPRHFFAATVYDNKMWIFGGQSNISPNYLNDVWYSSDGASWTEATSSAGFHSRYAHAATVFNNRMQIMGGFYNGVTYNDVWWSTDGSTWNADANAAWSTREEIRAEVLSDKIYVIAGFNWPVAGAPALLNDVWEGEQNSPTVTPTITETVTPTVTPYPQVTIVNDSTLKYYNQVAAPTPITFTAGVRVESSSLDFKYYADWGVYPGPTTYFFVHVPEQLYTNGLRINTHGPAGGSWATNGKSATNTAVNGFDVSLLLSYGLMDQAPLNAGFTAGHYEMQAYLAPDLTSTPVLFGAPMVFDVYTPTLTVTRTHTLTVTPTVTPTATPTPIYAYSGQDIFMNTYVNITTTTGTYRINNEWGINIQPLVQLVPNALGAYVGSEACIMYDAKSITINVYSSSGSIENCSSGCSVAVTIYRDRKNFPWW